VPSFVTTETPLDQDAASMRGPSMIRTSASFSPFMIFSQPSLAMM
jgi:hypothetical protein